MRSILNTLLIFGALYLLMNNAYKKEVKTAETSEQKVTQSTPTDTKIANEIATENQTSQKPQVEKLGFLSNFAANVVVKMAESEKGSDLILKLVKPLTVRLNQPVVKTNNTVFFDQTFEVLNINPITQDSTKIAYCGAEVVIDYHISKQGLRIDTKENQRIILGRGEAHPIIENLVVGMQEGQKRRGKIPYPYLGKLSIYTKNDEDKEPNVNVEVSLIEVLSPELHNIKIFDDAVSVEATQLCGYPISCNARISKIDGTKLWESKINYQLGDKVFPTIFSYSLFNKLPESTRTVISPFKYLDKLIDNMVDSSVNPDEFVLIEFK
ncbi:hypothetical protein phytr_8630 [Candidatus Phycorickettsia trachydisci]|uniref:Uncharacterized protein n=1 Tax=Candidatus Phycorickettsia trachydisci TaxID=2115978 RepID=A0A2P1P964_9RICK|nr:hypothetical protein [Candidatus Phycorickettsia trachydisci]AVP87795.1 hypothetical protein phytr_8630 [Candidatus Phycorickettsia trachydisci]